MRLGYFTMPMHPMHRNWAETLKEDREAVILADKLGFQRLHRRAPHRRRENITNSMMFLATLIPRPSRSGSGTGTTNLSQMHPVLIAAQAAMFDHLAKGRFILGISPGALPTDAEALGILDEDRNQLFAEAIDVILAIWERDPPYDIDFPGNRFKVTTATHVRRRTRRRHGRQAFQKPRPEIVGTVVAPFSQACVLMGKRDFHPLSANFLLPQAAASRTGANYAEGQGRGRRRRADPTTGGSRARSSSPTTTRRRERYGREDAEQPVLLLLRADAARKIAARQAAVRVQDAQEQPDEEITLDYVLRELVIHGTSTRWSTRSWPAGGNRRVRRAGLRRHGLGRPGARQALDAAAGRRGDAAGERRDREEVRRSVNTVVIARTRIGAARRYAAERIGAISAGSSTASTSRTSAASCQSPILRSARKMPVANSPA